MPSLEVARLENAQNARGAVVPEWDGRHPQNSGAGGAGGAWLPQ